MRRLPNPNDKRHPRLPLHLRLMDKLEWYPIHPVHQTFQPPPISQMPKTLPEVQSCSESMTILHRYGWNTQTLLNKNPIPHNRLTQSTYVLKLYCHHCQTSLAHSKVKIIMHLHLTLLPNLYRRAAQHPITALTLDKGEKCSRAQTRTSAVRLSLLL